MHSVFAFVIGWCIGICGTIVVAILGMDMYRSTSKLLRRVRARLLHTPPACRPLMNGSRTSKTNKKSKSAGDGDGDDHDGDDDDDVDACLEREATHRRSLREEGLEGFAGRTTNVMPLKLNTTCLIGPFDGFAVVEAPQRYRLALLGTTISVYELLCTKGKGDAEDGCGTTTSAEVVGEHLKGKFDVEVVDVEEAKVVGNKRINHLNAFAGRALLLTTKDGRAFLANRDVENNNTALGSTMRSASPSSPRGMFGSTTNNNSVAAAGNNNNNNNTTPAATSGTTPPATATMPASPMNLHHHHDCATGMSTWSSVLIKFHDNRDAERWLTVLRSISEVEAWRHFVKSMPNTDTTNMFLSRFFFQNIHGPRAGLEGLITKLIRTQLKKVTVTKFPRDLGGEIILDDFIIGTQIPSISDVSDPTVSTDGEMGFDFNLQYRAGAGNGFSLFFRLALTFMGFRIPHVVFSVKMLELEATIHVSIGQPPSKKFWIAGHKPPVLRVELHPGCASHSGLLHRLLSSLPDLSGVVANLIKLYLFGDMILPYMDDFALPSIIKTPPVSPTEFAKVRTFDWRAAAAKSAAPAAAHAEGRRRGASSTRGGGGGEGAAESVSSGASPSRPNASNKNSNGTQHISINTPAATMSPDVLSGQPSGSYAAAASSSGAAGTTSPRTPSRQAPLRPTTTTFSGHAPVAENGEEDEALRAASTGSFAAKTMNARGSPSISDAGRTNATHHDGASGSTQPHGRHTTNGAASTQEKRRGMRDRLAVKGHDMNRERVVVQDRKRR